MPAERLECGYTMCIKCQNEKPYVGFLNVTHKTGNDTILIKSDDTESIRKAVRFRRRGR